MSVWMPRSRCVSRAVFTHFVKFISSHLKMELQSNKSKPTAQNLGTTFEDEAKTDSPSKINFPAPTFLAADATCKFLSTSMEMI